MFPIHGLCDILGGLSGTARVSPPPSGTHLCLISGMLMQLAAATAAKGTKRPMMAGRCWGGQQGAGHGEVLGTEPAVPRSATKENSPPSLLPKAAGCSGVTTGSPGGSGVTEGPRTLVRALSPNAVTTAPVVALT